MSVLPSMFPDWMSYATPSPLLLWQRGLGVADPSQLLPHITAHLRVEPYSLDELCADDAFGVHPNTLFDGGSGLLPIAVSQECILSRSAPLPNPVFDLNYWRGEGISSRLLSPLPNPRFHSLTPVFDLKFWRGEAFPLGFCPQCLPQVTASVRARWRC